MGTEVFWIRLFCAQFDDARWLAVEQMPDADAVQVIFIKMLLIAGRSNANGILLLHEGLPYDLTTLSAVLRRSVQVVQFALNVLEKFKFIEVIDNVVAIIDWDKLQSTDELSRLSAKRQKDKERKRLERKEQRKLLLGSTDMSMDSPRMSEPINTNSNTDSTSINTTTPEEKNEGVVCFEMELERLLTVIPPEVITDRLTKKLRIAALKFGASVTEGNIRYALKNHDPEIGTLGGMIISAVLLDFNKSTRLKLITTKAEKAFNQQQNEHKKAMQKELEEKQHKEDIAREDYWKNLSGYTRKKYINEIIATIPPSVDSLGSAIIEAAASVNAWYDRTQLNTIYE